MAFGGWVRTTTDADGRFAVELPPGERLELRAYDIDHHYTSDGEPEPRERVARSWTVTSPDDDLGDVPLAWWPYRDEVPVPRAAAVDGTLPQQYTAGFRRALDLSVARALPVKALLEAERLLGPDRPTAAEIQAHQPVVRSVRADAAAPGVSRSDAWLGDLLLNGFHIALNLGRDADDPRRLRAVMDWGEVAPRTDGPGFDLYDVDVVLEPRSAEVVPVRIDLRIRRAGPTGWASDQRRSVAPGDPDWEAAKRIVRCQHLLQGAIDGHIVTGHFQTEAAAVAVFRNLRASPIRRLLHAHLQEIVPQGRDGDGFAWGPNGILLTQSALTYQALQDRMRRLTAGMCWETFAPGPPVHPSHRYAHAAERFWALLGRYVAGFFAANHDEIVAAWPEVRRFSDDWVRRSPPYDPLPADPRVVTLREAGPVRRVEVDGILRSAPPVTTTDAPAPGDLERLQQLCKVILFRATFDHTWTHDGQYDAGGDLLLATFGLRNGGLGPESDASLLPPPSVMLDAITVNSIGIHANYGMILADEERDVPPALKAAVEAEREAFAALGVDVDHIRSRINI
ncbi:MAG: hypothetical protein ABMB14_26775 [Myxococcota bacterium]